jgi:hypothetical protein
MVMMCSLAIERERGEREKKNEKSRENSLAGRFKNREKESVVT